MNAVLTAQGLEKSFGLRRVLGGVSFAVHEGDRVGLVGVNGSGKSTLLRILLGGGSADESADAGLVTRKRELTVEYVPQEPRLDPSLTVTQALRQGLRAHAAALEALEALERELAQLEGSKLDAAIEAQALLHARVQSLGGWDQDHEIRGLAAALELPPADAAIDTLSLGERRRVALARALLARPELLALDEPTNHLDAQTTAWLEDRLREHAGTLLLVTHDRYFLDRVATRIFELDRGRLFTYEGGYSAFLEKQAERLEQETRRERERASFVRRELEWIRRGAKARSTKQKARIDRFDAALAAAPGPSDRLAGEAILRLSTGGRLGKTILELRGLGKSVGKKPLFRDLSLVFKPGDRIGVVGPNGAGKTTLVRTLLGELAPDAGEVIVGHNTRMALLDQGRAELRDDRTVLEEVSGDSEIVELEGGPVHARTFLRMLLFDDGFADTPVGALSGGERNRVQLAKLLRAGANFLVLDEPTNDLDLMTLGVLEEALRVFGGCALVVSHDRWFLDRVATGILAFEGEGRTVLYEGSCSDYLSKSGLAFAKVPSSPRKSANRPVAADRREQKGAPRARRLSFEEQSELRGIEGAIGEAEASVAELERTLQDPSVYQTRGPEVPALVAELERRRLDVERLYARWQELEGIAAAAGKGAS